MFGLSTIMEQNSCLNSLYQWTAALLTVLSNYVAVTTAPNVEAFNGLEPQREMNSVAKDSFPSSNSSKRYIIQHTLLSSPAEAKLNWSGRVHDCMRKHTAVGGLLGAYI